MQNIIVATDFSAKSLNALNMAVQIVERSNGCIHLIHVLQPVVGNYAKTLKLHEDLYDSDYLLRLAESLDDQLRSLKSTHEEESFEIKTLLRVGDPFIEIEKLSYHVGADLVILGDKGITNAEEFFIGSLADKVVRQMPCPVVIAKPVFDDAHFQHIVYATDLHEDSTQAIRLLKQFQRLFKSMIHIVYINTRKHFRNDVDVMIQLEDLVERADLKRYTLATYNHEDEEYGLVYFAETRRADLIAIRMHESSGFRRLISGGELAPQVASHKFRSIMTYRAKAFEN